MNVIFTGGGTGGHIFPAIAIAESLRIIKPDVNILFIGAKGKIEEKIVPTYNFKLATIKIYGLNKKQIFKTFILPIVFFNAVSDCKKIFYDFSPDLVLGTGAFVSAPVFYTAIKMKVPFIIQEGNAYPGKVTKFFSPRANKVVINFEETKNYLKSSDNIIRIPHPIREYKERINRDNIIRNLGINPDLKTIFIFGGSQGSASINKAVLMSIEDLYNLNINIIWQTGKNEYVKIKELTNKFSDYVKVFDFIYNMDEVYSISDLVICRAGITSIMEISAYGKPSILIPFPFAARNHQEKNAQMLEKEDSCIILKDNELQEKLYKTVRNLIQDENKMKQMAKNVRKIADIDAAKKIALEIIKTLKNE